MIDCLKSRPTQVRSEARVAAAALVGVAGLLIGSGTAYAVDACLEANDCRVLPGATYCGFDVYETTLVDNRRSIDNASGSHLNGHYVVQFTNPANGTSVTYNVSGATQESKTDGILTQTFTGPSFVELGPRGRDNTGLTGISYLTGRTVLTVDLNAKPQPRVTDLSTTAPVTDVCGLLA